MAPTDTTTTETRDGYARDYVTLPPVRVGDRVRVTYTSGQTGTEQVREGEVREVAVNGFEFDHGKEGKGYRTGVREHEHGGRVDRRVSTLSYEERADVWGHASNLNTKHTAPESVTVENLTAAAEATETAVDPLALEEGDTLTVTYVSVYGDHPTKTVVGEVSRVETRGYTEWPEDGRAADATFVPILVQATLVVPGDADREVSSHYEDITETKRVVFWSHSGEWEVDAVESRNGARWHRISRRVSDAQASRSPRVETDGGREYHARIEWSLHDTRHGRIVSYTDPDSTGMDYGHATDRDKEAAIRAFHKEILRATEGRLGDLPVGETVAALTWEAEGEDPATEWHLGDPDAPEE